MGERPKAKTVENIYQNESIAFQLKGKNKSYIFLFFYNETVEIYNSFQFSGGQWQFESFDCFCVFMLIQYNIKSLKMFTLLEVFTLYI